MRGWLYVGLLFVCPPLFSQGPVDGFFKPKNDIDLALSGGYNFANKYFAGATRINYRRNQSVFSFYANMGLSKRWNLIVTAPMINFRAQDVGVYGKFKLLQKQSKKGEVTLGSALGFSLPTWNYPTETGQAIGQQTISIQPLFVAQFKHNQGWFVQGQARYNYAFNPVPSALIGSAKFGYIRNKLYLDVWYELQHGFGDKDYLGSVPYESFRELVTSHHRIGGVVYYNISEKLGLFVNGGYTLAGRNTSQALSVGAGIVIKMKVKRK